MTTEMWLGFAAFIIGLVLIAGAAFRKQAGWKMNPVYSFVIGAVLVVFGGAIGVVPMFEGEALNVNVDVDAPGVTVEKPTFEIECKNGTAIDKEMTVEVDEDDTGSTFIFDANPGGVINANYSALNFSITPVPPEGSTADSLATIYFETDYDMKFGGEYILQESGGVYFANWTYRSGDNTIKTADYSGSMTMLMTESAYAEIDYNINADETDAFGEELDTVGQGGSWDITFHNSDWSWSWTHTVNWIYIA